MSESARVRECVEGGEIAGVRSGGGGGGDDEWGGVRSG